MENISNPNVTIGIKTEGDNTLPTASVFERAVAFIIDLMLWVIISTSVYKFVGSNSASTYAIISVILFFAYLTIGNTGKLQTIGKFLMGIKVINRKTKGNISILSSFLRVLGYILSFATLGIGFVFILFSKKRLALEDLIAGTEVVTVRNKSNAEMTLVSFLGTLLVIGAVFVVYNNLIFNPYKAMKESARDQLVKIAYLEELHKNHYGVYTNDLLRLALLSGDAVQFQRDMQQYFRPNGFRIALNKNGNGYLIEGFAKDNADPKKSSLVSLSK